MATNKFDNEGNPLAPYLKTGADLIKGAIAVAPLGLAGYMGYKRIAANESLNPVSASGFHRAGGHIRKVGLALGKGLAKSAVVSEAAKQKAAEKTLNTMMETDSLKEMFRRLGSMNAVIQTLTESLDDPSLTLSPGMADSFRNQLMNLADKSIDEGGAEDLLRSTVKTITDSLSTEGKIRWETNLNEYNKIKTQLVAPFEIPGNGQVYEKIRATSLKQGSIEQKRYRSLLEGLGGHFEKNIEIVQVQSSQGKQAYARLYNTANKNTRRFQVDLPLSDAGPTGSIRMGKELSASYHPTNKLYLDGEAAEELRHGGANLKRIFKETQLKLPDIWREELLSRIDTSDGTIKFAEGRTGKTEFGEYRRQFVAFDPWTISTGEVLDIKYPGLVAHQKQAIEHQANTAMIFFKGRKKDKDIIKSVSKIQAMAGARGGVPPDNIFRRLLDDTPYGTIGIGPGSILSEIKSILPESGDDLSRADFPFISREMQLGGRIDAFVRDPSARKVKLGRSVWYSGPTAELLANHDMSFPGELTNIDIANKVTGGTNRAILFSVKKDMPWHMEQSGLGAAYGAGEETMLRFFTKPLLYPEANEVMGSKFLKELVSRVENAGGAGTLVKFSRDEIAKHQYFAGIGGGGKQFMPTDPFIKDFFLTYVHKPMEGKHGIQVFGPTTRKTKIFKTFSAQLKALIELLPEDVLMRILPKEQRQMLKELGIGAKQLVVAPGDMFKKGPGFIGLQLRAGYGMVAGDTGVLTQLAESGKYTQTLGKGSLAQFTGATIEALGNASKRKGAKPISDLMIGSVLAAVYHQGGDYVDPKAISSMVSNVFGKRAPGIIDVMETGWALSGSSLFAGMAQEAYGKSLVGIEPRTMQHLQYRFRRMGMGTEEINEVLLGIFQRKQGVVGNIRAAIGLEQMLKGTHGIQGVLDFVAQSQEEIPILDLRNLSELGTGEITEQLRKYPAGFILDLTKGKQTAAHLAIGHEAKRVLGQGQLYISNQKVFDAVRGTIIKTIDGNKQIGGRFQNLVEYLIKNLATIENNAEGARTKTGDYLETFKKNINELSAEVSDSVLRGKVRGATMNIGLPYNLSTGTRFRTQKQWEMAKALTTQARNSGSKAAFLNSYAFMNTLKDFMGTSQGTRKDGAELAEEFFTGLHLRGAETPGWVGLAGRNPTVSLGHLDTATYFRDVVEALPLDEGGAAQERQLHNFLAVEKSKGEKGWYIQASRKMGKDWPGTPRTWGQVAELPEDIRGSFFKRFVNTLDEFMGEGEGIVYHPVEMEDIVVEGYKKPLRVNLGFATQFVGDYDADPYMTIMVNKESREILSKAAAAPEAADYRQAMREYTIKTAIFEKETKAGLESFRTEHLVKQAGGDLSEEALRKARLVWESGTEKIRQDYLKEVGAKTGVGPLDVELNVLRQAMEDMPIANRTAGRQFDTTLAFLKVLEEHTTIKGKKLPMFLPFAGRIKAGVQQLLEGNAEPLEGLLRRDILRDSRIATEGIKVPGIQGRIRLSDIMETLRNAGEYARTNKIANTITPSRTTGVLNKAMRQGEKDLIDLLAGKTLSGSVARGFEGPTPQSTATGISSWFNKLGGTAGRMDKRLMGIAAAGVAGSVMVGGMLSNGYSPEPLVTAGEVVSPRVRNEIASSSLFSTKQAGPTPADLTGRQTGYLDMSQRPINMGTAYMEGQNSYQIRGQINSTRGIAQVQSYYETLTGGRSTGSIKINDARRPITANYLDRLMGY
jgi:hypothetical protein